MRLKSRDVAKFVASYHKANPALMANIIFLVFHKCNIMIYILRNEYSRMFTSIVKRSNGITWAVLVSRALKSEESLGEKFPREKPSPRRAKQSHFIPQTWRYLSRLCTTREAPRSRLSVNDSDCIRVHFRVTTQTAHCRAFVRSYVHPFAWSVSLRSTAAFIRGLTASRKNADYSVRGALKSRGIHVRGMLTTYGLMNEYARVASRITCAAICLPTTKIKRTLAQHRYFHIFY